MNNIEFVVACKSNCTKLLIVNFLSWIVDQPPRRECSFTELGKQLIMLFIAFLNHLVLIFVIVLMYIIEVVVEASSSTYVP